MVTGFGLRRVHFRIESMFSIGKVALVVNFKVCRLDNGFFDGVRSVVQLLCYDSAAPAAASDSRPLNCTNSANK